MCSVCHYTCSYTLYMYVMIDSLPPSFPLSPPLPFQMTAAYNTVINESHSKMNKKKQVADPSVGMFCM